ncbi:MAG: acyl-CoA dehydrogenase, partial [Gammaproteobacteria bacterium]|nr:acyl-CoA dehydrogenase [Gammaproteobacteria bacterium]
MDGKRDWNNYIGRIHEETIFISSDRIRGLAALLDYDRPPWSDNVVPPTGHWLAMFPFTRQSQLGHDGHEKLGDFIPDTGYPRRMWVGGRIQYWKPLYVNQPILHRTTITNVEDKKGKTGPMTFVTLGHEYLVNDEVILKEEQKIVYRVPSSEPAVRPANKPVSKPEAEFDWSRQFIPDSTVLFRYSAVTFNAHKIHFDHEYVKEEGYPGLLVHAPLTATLLIELYTVANTGVKITSFEYSARNPLYDGDPIMLYAKAQEDGTVSLWAEDCAGN